MHQLREIPLRIIRLLRRRPYDGDVMAMRPPGPLPTLNAYATMMASSPAWTADMEIAISGYFGTDRSGNVGRFPHVWSRA